jgi:hypothetical protein
MDRTLGWKMIYKTPGRSLRYFRRTIGGEIEAIPRVAVADNSGPTPDKTDDGILWIDFERPWIIENDRFSIPVTRDGDRGLWTGESLEALFDLLDALRKPKEEGGVGEEALRVICKPSPSAGLAARAVIRCLAFGVRP